MLFIPLMVKLSYDKTGVSIVVVRNVIEMWRENASDQMATSSRLVQSHFIRYMLLLLDEHCCR